MRQQRLTPEMLATGYEYLRVSEPFRGWRGLKLPTFSEIKFIVVKDRQKSADFGYENGVPTIRVSTARNGHTDTVLMTLAHEALHLFQALNKLDRGGEHNRDFWKRAERICMLHGWDRTLF